jgi:tetratricopeptide (TPR) repeat protein
VLVLILALAIRIAYLVHIHDNVSFQIIALDSELYDQKALEIIQGDFWGNEIFYSAPLYPYFLALLYTIFGPGFLVVRIVQIVLGALTAVLVVRLGELLFDEPVPLIAGLVSALYAPFIFFNATILGTALAVFLATLSVFLFCWSQSTGRRAELLILLAGAATGLTSLARPNTVVVLPLWVLCLWVVHRGWRWVRPAAILLVGAAVVIGPVTIRNAVVGRDFVPISSHGGINFWIGNHPNALGTFDLPPGIRGTPEQVNLVDSTRLATQALGRPLKPSEISSFWFRQGWEYIQERPDEFSRLVLRKGRYFWNRFEIPLNVNFHFLRRFTPFLRVPLMHFGLISPLALLGLFLAFSRWKRLLPAYAFIAVYFLSAVAFFVSGRYRLPATPLFILFASFVPWWVYQRIRDRGWKRLGVAAVAFVALAVHANVPVEGFSIERSFGRDYYYLGAHYRSEGQIEEAIYHYRESLRHNPDFWMSYNGLGICLADQHRLDEAIEVFRRAMRMAPTRAEPWSNMGIALASHGRLAEAIEAWERALELDPYNESVRANMNRARELLEQESPQKTITENTEER